MRSSIVHPGADNVSYEIRGIVDFARQIEAAGVPVTWENIGDPVAKGEQVPLWIRELVAGEAMAGPASYGYSPTKGLETARVFLAEQRRRETGVKLPPDDILFFNGLGDAISKMYACLHPQARVLMPNPAYPSHSSLEAAHAGAPGFSYRLDPAHGWQPDMAEIRRTVSKNPAIAGMLVINPDNPTGAVYPRQVLEEFVAIAREFRLFLAADEIYANLTHDPADFVSLAELAGDDVPLMIMRGLSKEVPWPGSRCGWIEFYNAATDPDFARYARSLEEAKMTEVCSTTLPQAVLPRILGDERYAEHLASRRRKYRARAQEAVRLLEGHPALSLVTPKGAFYLAVTFQEDYRHRAALKPAANPQAQALLDAMLARTADSDFDKHFCYQLLAATGICTVPLSTGFNSGIHGFRLTLLEGDDEVFTRTIQAISEFCR